MYEIDTVTGYMDEGPAAEEFTRMWLSPAETWVVGSQEFISGLPAAPEGVIIHADATVNSPNCVVTGDAKVWLETPGGVLCFRSGYFADAVKTSFGVTPPSLQPAAVAPAPPVDVPAPAETLSTEPTAPEPVPVPEPAPEAVQPSTEGDPVPVEPEGPPTPY